MASSPLSIVFFGTSAFAVPSLQTLAQDSRFTVEAVITQPDKPVGRKQEMTPSPVKNAALSDGLPLHQPDKIREAFSSLHLAPPDFLVVVSYGQLLSQEMLDFPRIAPVNLHASLLPRWRGASPLQHAILAGDAETGVTVQRMAYELDAGPILSQTATRIAPDETTPVLHDRLAAMGAILLRDTILAPLRPVEQPKDGITYCRKLVRDDGRVDPAALRAEDIDRRVRALTPWPGVTMETGGRQLKILASALEERPESVAIPCAEGTTLYLLAVQPAGKKPMPGVAWARGRH
ncbi:MAG: methionyl-tRNA formyltransferase [Candidatus Peribacteraceae bacterium]|nr:methionyl-tRNA formyltransferase [Candidatus Peribacteraceae bacterium]